MSYVRIYLVALFFLTLLVGCRSAPNLPIPGTIRQQQLRAMRHDPYSDDDIGPAVVGGRPREFQKAAPQPVRNQPLPLNTWQGPLAPAPLY